MSHLNETVYQTVPSPETVASVRVHLDARGQNKVEEFDMTDHSHMTANDPPASSHCLRVL